MDRFSNYLKGSGSPGGGRWGEQRDAFLQIHTIWGNSITSYGFYIVQGVGNLFSSRTLLGAIVDHHLCSHSAPRGLCLFG